MLCYNECKRVNYSIAFVIMNGKEFFYVSPDWKNTFLFYKIYHTSSVRRIHGRGVSFFGVNFDKMNGYEFEEYAARYLKRQRIFKNYCHQSFQRLWCGFNRKKHRTTYAVQCKLYQGKVGNSAVQEAVAGKSYYDCDEAMVITNSVFYPGAIALARANDVILIDGTQLKTSQLPLGQIFPDYPASPVMWLTDFLYYISGNCTYLTFKKAVHPNDFIYNYYTVVFTPFTLACSSSAIGITRHFCPLITSDLIWETFSGFTRSTTS